MTEQELKECIAEVKNSDMPAPSKKKVASILYGQLYKNGWISCSKKIPDVPEGTEDDFCPEFNVTVQGATEATTLKCDHDGTWFDDFGNLYTVIAWQPLPAAYRPQIS